MWRWKSNHRNNHQWQNSTRRLALTHCLGFGILARNKWSKLLFWPSCQEQKLWFLPRPVTDMVSTVFNSNLPQDFLVHLLLGPKQSCARIEIAPVGRYLHRLHHSEWRGRLYRDPVWMGDSACQQRVHEAFCLLISMIPIVTSHHHQSIESVGMQTFCKNCAKASNLYNLDQFN